MFRKYAQQIDLINVIFFLCLLPFMFVGVGSYYIIQLDKILRDDLEKTLLNVSIDSAHTAQLRMESSLRRLEGIADNTTLCDNYIPLEDKMKILREEAKKHGWQDILIADDQGRTQSSSNKTMNVSRRNYFAKAMQGNPYYSSILNSPLYDVPIVAHAVPLIKDFTIVGTLIAIEDARELYFTVDTRSNPRKDIETFFVDNNGILLDNKKLLNKHFYTELAKQNNLSTKEVKNIITNRDNIDRHLTYNGEEYYLLASLIDESGWSVITLIQKKDAVSELNDIIYLSVGIIAIMVLLLAAYIVYLLKIRKTYKHHSHIAQTALHVEGIFYVSIDHNMRILYANEGLNKSLGLNPDSTNYLTHFFEDIQMESLARLLNANTPFVLPIVMPKGGKIFIQWNVLPSGEKNNWRMLGIDVSAHHHKVEVELAHNHNSELQQIIDSLPSPIMMHALDGEILMANAKTKQFLGVESLEDIYNFINTGIGNELFNAQLRNLASIKEHKQSITDTIDFVQPDGSSTVFQSVFTPLFDENGEIKAAVSLSTDITAAVDMQKKLEDEISRLQVILEKCPAGVFFSKDSIIKYCNPMAQEMAGVYVGGPAPSGDTMVEGDVQGLYYNVTNGIDTYDAPFTIRDTNGKLRNLLITAIAITWRDEQLSVLWALEVTEMRTIQRELMHARDAAESATQAKSDFLATMSHEIRTPMNAILGFLHLFERKNLSDKQRNYIEKITISATGLLRIINDILDFSKIEANKMSLEYAPFDLEASINAIHSIMSFAAHEKGLDLTSHFEPDVPKVIVGDRERINQILLNLLGNAIKFTHSGEVSLSIKVQKVIDAEHVILDFIVSDTGIGLSEEQATKLFQPFTQADTSTSRRFGGTGLGLVISTRLAALMGGSIDLKSKLGEGSTFTCSIHAQVDNDINIVELTKEVSDNLFNSEGYTHVELSDLKGKRVLLVEDNLINQEIAAALLEDYGFDLDFANNGQEAVERVQMKEYDLVLMDIQMPVMDGLQATKQIRSLNLPYAQSMPIIAMTANVMTEDKQRCTDAGMNAHVAKPISPHALRNTLIQWLYT